MFRLTIRFELCEVSETKDQLPGQSVLEPFNETKRLQENANKEASFDLSFLLSANPIFFGITS